MNRQGEKNIVCLIESPLAGGYRRPPVLKFGGGINRPQNDTKMTQRDPKMAPRSTKMASRAPQEGPRWTPRWPEKPFKSPQEWESRDYKRRRIKKHEKWFCILKFWAGFQGPRGLKIELPCRRELDFHCFAVSQKTTLKRRLAR